MLSERVSGILLHPTSLPGPHGIGDFGPEAYAFVDYLVAAGQKRWQVLPLGATGYADSPYASFSSFAGNPLLVSLELLFRAGDLTSEEIKCIPSELSAGRVEYGPVIAWKVPNLRTAASRFRESSNGHRVSSYVAFCELQSTWLDDYALFMAIKKVFDDQARRNGDESALWNTYWDRDIATREASAIERWQESCREEIEIQKILQFFFFEQWLGLKRYANEQGIQIIGDLPIYVALDSSDVWASPKSFRLDANLRPILVAGVPPDYFSTTGQLWGNPVYDWEQMQNDGFRWWIQRFKGTCEMVDIVRVDHFRGFEAGWSIPVGHPTAMHGEWLKAPGTELFNAVRQQLGELPILAEDLGLITPEVEQLRDDNRFPGMKVLQFAFDSGPGPDNQFLPHNYLPNSVAYTGTHDNDTTLGWFASTTIAQRTFIKDYFGHEPIDVAWEFIRMALSSVSRLAVVPMQDVLCLGREARMNMPSTQVGNWSWRMPASYRSGNSAARLAKLVKLYDR
ncbi:MAG: 4-alpha-glucanotransferase [Pirellulaceae bacterium]|nr:4-alpha-glucanotransferase [Pirellulaceae bacterium]